MNRLDSGIRDALHVARLIAGLMAGVALGASLITLSSTIADLLVSHLPTWWGKLLGFVTVLLLVWSPAALFVRLFPRGG